MIGAGIFARLGRARTPRVEPIEGRRAAVAALKGGAIASARGALMSYDAATQPRAGRFRTRHGSADEISRDYRQRLAFISRDIIRNSPLGAAAVRVISGEIVGSGIALSLSGLSDDLQARARLLIGSHLQTRAIDADGRLDLYGIQRLAARAMVSDGECFVRRIRRGSAGGRALLLPFQVQVIEADHLDLAKTGRTAAGGEISEGIERDASGQVIAYHFFRHHPHGGWLRRVMDRSDRVEAVDVIHVFRVERPGQGRGVSWFAPVALRMQDLSDAIGANVMRQKIAACFVAFVMSPDDGDERPLSGMAEGEDGGGGSGASDAVTIEPGTVQDLRPGETVTFSSPPSVEGFDGFVKLVQHEIASGLGITFEALTGELSQVNFSSAKIGRLAMHRNVDDWRSDALVPTLCDGLARWLLEGWAVTDPRNAAQILAAVASHTPPARAAIEPLKDAKAAEVEVRAGFRSRRDVVLSQGRDPDRVARERGEDNAADLAARELLTTTTLAPPPAVAGGAK
jgi:lambda family phage portal protein